MQKNPLKSLEFLEKIRVKNSRRGCLLKFKDFEAKIEKSYSYYILYII